MGFFRLFMGLLVRKKGSKKKLNGREKERNFKKSKRERERERVVLKKLI